MRRIVANGLLLVSAPVGVGLGLWLARLTYLPYCPGRGLGTLDFCAARPSFAPRLCVVCGAAAAFVVLLVSIALRRGPSKVAIFDLGAAALGIALGLWASMITYPYPPCGPDLLCVTLLGQRFAAWESALIGGAATAAIVAIGAAVDADLRRVNLRAVGTMRHWLFRDLSGTTPGSDAG